MDTPIRVIVIDGQTLLRFGLFALFTRHSDIKFVADASSAEDGLRLIAAHQPDVVTLDVGKGRAGLALARELRDRYPRLGIVVLTSQGEDDVLFRALETGASAFVAKNAHTDEVLAAVRHAAVAASSFAATGLASAMARRSRQPEPGTLLSPRELQVLQLLGQGLSIPAIAKQMYLSQSTTKTYVARLYEKLGASNRSQALMTGLRTGLIQHQERTSA